MITLHQTIVFHATLSYLASQEPDVDPQLLQSIGIRPDQMHQLRALNTASLINLAARCEGCIRVEVDNDLLDERLREVDQLTAREKLMHEFIQHGASMPMMTSLFDLSERQFQRMRRNMALPSATGRPRDVRQDEQEAIYDAWQARGEKLDRRGLLDMAKELDMPLRLVWEDLRQNCDVELIDDGD